MKYLEKFNNYPILVLIVMLKDLKETFMELLNIQTLSNTSIHIEWWDFLIKLTIAILLWIVLKAYFKLRRETNDKMLVFSIIMYKKSKDILANSFADKNELDQYFIKEYIDTRRIVQNNFKDKSLNEIDKMMIEYYPDEVKNAIIKSKVSQKG